MRTMVFVDYWNLQLTLQSEDGLAKGLTGTALQSHRFQVDWFSLGGVLTGLADSHVSHTPGVPLGLLYQETRFYTSTDPGDAAYKNFATKTLASRPGIRVYCQDRRPKKNPLCPSCHSVMDVCPHCRNAINATQEKGVDTLLVTDLLRLGLDGSYDVAILVSQDSDMAPAAEHLASKGIKVIHAGIKHFGSGVAKKCWGSFDILPLRAAFERK